MVNYNVECTPPTPQPTTEKHLLKDYRWNYDGVITIPNTNLILLDPKICIKTIEYFPNTDTYDIYYYAIQGTQRHTRKIVVSKYQENIDNITDLHFLNEVKAGSMEFIDGIYTTQYQYGKYEYTFTDDSPWMVFEENIEYDFLAPSNWRKKKIETAKDAYGRYTYQLTSSKRWKVFSLDGAGWSTETQMLLDYEYDITDPIVHIVKIQHDVINDKFYVWLRLRKYDEVSGCDETWEYPILWEGIRCWDEINHNRIFEGGLFFGKKQFPPQPANGEGEEY